MTNPVRTNRRFVIAVCFTAVMLLLLWLASDVFFLVFGGVLLAIVLRSAAGFLARLTHLGAGWALAVTLLGMAAIISAAFLWLGPAIATQIDQLQNDVPAAWNRVEANLRQYRWGRELLSRASDATSISSHAGGIWSHILGAFSTFVSVIADGLVIFFLGLYFAIDPGPYRRGILALVPTEHEVRAGQVLDRLDQKLRHWILGKLALMLFVGAFTSLGLWLLHMPLIVTLAIIAALLDFIPNIGPIVAAIPAVLLAFTQGPKQALLVGALYITVQVMENYILQPLVQQRAVSLPPSLTLGAQILIGSLFGVMGLIFATPLTVVVVCLMEMLYVEDVLKKRPRVLVPENTAAIE